MNLLAFMFGKWRRAFGTKSQEQKIFLAGLLPRPIEGLAKYPPKEFAAKEGIYAYRLWLNVIDAGSVVACIGDCFSTVGSDEIQGGIHHANNGESISLAIFPEFKGVTLRLLTNSTNLLHAIDALPLQPPPPWAVFPYISPSSLDGMQGAVDFWWRSYWSPFWEAASPSGREEYLRVHKVPEVWYAYFKFLE